MTTMKEVLALNQEISHLREQIARTDGEAKTLREKYPESVKELKDKLAALCVERDQLQEKYSALERHYQEKYSAPSAP